MNDAPDLVSVLNSTMYPELVYQILTGNDYAVSIADSIHKKRSIVAQQLYVLEKYGLIKKTSRDKAQHFEVDKNKLFKIAFEQVHPINPNEVFNNTITKKFLADLSKKRPSPSIDYPGIQKMMTADLELFTPELFTGCFVYCVKRKPGKSLASYLNEAHIVLLTIIPSLQHIL